MEAIAFIAFVNVHGISTVINLCDTLCEKWKRACPQKDEITGLEEVGTFNKVESVTMSAALI